MTESAKIWHLFKISDAIALLDMLAAFAQLAASQDYIKPEKTETLAIKDGRHAIQEKIHADKFVPNDYYATQQSRFQIITGCNMSGKSTYIRSLALMAVMAQIGSFIPASYASIPVFHQLFARISIDDSIESSISTYAAEMREMAFILRNIDRRSIVIIDELGRGTSTRDGLAIAIAMSEAMIDSRALVWFVTHFRDLATILKERNGVVSMHLAVDMGEVDKMTMLYKIAPGSAKEKHYGIAMAKVMNFPPAVLRVAEDVSNTIARNVERHKKASKAVAIARRRKLVLGLREQLMQARDGNMRGNVLLDWLRKLQAEFVIRMTAINAEIQTAGTEENMDEEGENKGETLASHEDSSPAFDDEEASQLLPSDGDADQRYMMTGALQVEVEENE